MEPEQHQNVLYIERERCGCGGRTTTTERLLWSQQLLLLTSPPAHSPTRTSHNKLLQDCKSEKRQKSGRRAIIVKIKTNDDAGEFLPSLERPPRHVLLICRETLSQVHTSSYNFFRCINGHFFKYINGLNKTCQKKELSRLLRFLV